MTHLEDLKAAEIAAYEATRAAKQAAIALLDSAGRVPSNKTRRAAYEAAVDRAEQAFAAWEKADRALRGIKALHAVI